MCAGRRASSVSGEHRRAPTVSCARGGRGGRGLPAPHDFVAPGRETVYAEFRLDETVLDEIRAATANGEKYLRWFDTEVKTAAGDVVARVRKQIYVRRKRPM